jgi:hypothetical protein
MVAIPKTKGSNPSVMSSFLFFIKVFKVDINCRIEAKWKITPCVVMDLKLSFFSIILTSSIAEQHEEKSILYLMVMPDNHSACLCPI